jgi:hypothetical protein
MPSDDELARLKEEFDLGWRRNDHTTPAVLVAPGAIQDAKDDAAAP